MLADELVGLRRGAVEDRDHEAVVGPVEGQVLLEEKPLDMVRVLFVPDTAAENSGAHSESVTDAEGHFDLIYSQDAEVHGAVTGWHRVVLEDIAAEEATATGNFRPIRIPDRYSMAGTTPL